MKINKKNLVTSGLAILLAVGLLIGGGTWSYLQSTSNNVDNTFDTNKVKVDLTESGDGKYDIIPGTSQDKDPKVTVENSVDAYVYVEVTDKTQELVTYEIADGWEKLAGYENVYYREVSANEDTNVFSVLKDDKVSYDASITNEDMKNIEDTENIKLSFKAYAIQKAPFNDAVKAYKVKDAEFVSNTETLNNMIKEGIPVTLNQDITLNVNNTDDSTTVQALANSTINLNGKTLSIINADKGININDGNSMIITNGTIKWESLNSNPMIALRSNSEVTLQDVIVKTDSCINVEPGTQPAKLNIVDSTINSSDYYGVSTNAANNETGKTVEINIKNSTINVQENLDTNYDSTAVLFNVPGKLNIVDSDLTSERQAVIVRCGTANITNSVLTTTAQFIGSAFDKYDGSIWGSGNEVPLATLVVGNRSSANAYPYDATCTLTNTTLNIPEAASRHQIYAAAYNGHTTTINTNGTTYTITQDCGTDSSIKVSNE